MGSWQNADSLYRIATILSCASIVVTAVYILRAVGQAIMGPLPHLHSWRGAGGEVDATWNEKFAAIILLAGIVVIGVAPFWLHHLITPATETIIQHALKTVTLK